MSNTTQPIINAADLSPKDLSAWLSKLAGDAERAGQGYEITLLKLGSAEESLRHVEKDLGHRISYLASTQIIRSADHSSAIQGDLNSLRVIHSAVRDMQQTTLALIDQLQQTSHISLVRDRGVHLQECAEQGLATGSVDQ